MRTGRQHHLHAANGSVRIPYPQFSRRKMLDRRLRRAIYCIHSSSPGTETGVLRPRAPLQRRPTLPEAKMSALPRRQPAAPTDSDADDAEFLAALGRQVRESRERRGLARKAVSQSAGVSERYLA